MKKPSKEELLLGLICKTLHPKHGIGASIRDKYKPLASTIQSHFVPKDKRVLSKIISNFLAEKGWWIVSEREFFDGKTVKIKSKRHRDLSQAICDEKNR